MKKLILVAQENADSRKAVMNALQPFYLEGYYIISCLTGDDILKKMSLGTPKLLIVDLALPEMNGFQVINKLKSNLATIEIPIIVLSQPTMGIFKFMCRSMGINYFANRPISPHRIYDYAKLCLAEEA